MPIYDIQVGNAEGQLPIRKLQQHVMKLPRNLKGGQVSELNYRLKALPQAMQAPRGPLPKGARLPKGPEAQDPVIPLPKAWRTACSAAGHCHVIRAAPACRTSHPDDDRVGGAIVQPAHVTVDDERRDHGEQQDRPDERPAEADRLAVKPYDAQPGSRLPTVNPVSAVSRYTSRRRWRRSTTASEMRQAR